MSSKKMIGNDPQTGLLFNLSGGGSETITVTFDRPVLNVSFAVRDLSWYEAVSANSTNYPNSLPATPQEAISFSVPTTVTNVAQPGAPGTALSSSGQVAAGTSIYRTSKGQPPGETNHNYYDISVSISGPVSSFAITYGYGPSAPASGNAAILSQLNDLRFCAGT